ncbi:MAG: hypothetical protein IJI22_03455 [Bacilli bacterium]|nr:hypothetical protein [Bacilli bacterium]
MNIKNIAYILMTMSFIMIISGGVSSFVNELHADKERTYNRINLVNDEFEVFSANTSVFEEFRDELHENVLNNLYLETMYQDDIATKNKLSNYENLVDELVKNVKKLDKLCTDVYYPDSSANSKCSNYKTIYEQVINYFVADINEYNKNITKYNEYQKAIDPNLLLKKYNSKKEYIDYDGDGDFAGKED